MKIWLYSTILIVIFSLLLSCDNSSELNFKKKPEIIPYDNLSAPLTCYIDFELKTEFEKVAFLIQFHDHELKIEYDSSDKNEKGYPLFLFQPATEHMISLEITGMDGITREVKEKLFFLAPPLPEKVTEFPDIIVTRKNANKMEKGFTLINPRLRVSREYPNAREINQGFGMLAIIDHNGEVLWYYRTDSRISDFDLLPNGNISYMTQDFRLVEIDLTGNIINQWYAANRPFGEHKDAIPVDALTFHHDTEMTADGNWLMLSTELREIKDYYSSETNAEAPLKDQQVMGDLVIEFNSSGKVLKRWNSFDHLPVMRIGYDTFNDYWGVRGFPGTVDWSHANAVVPIEKDNSFLVNFRQQSAMIKVDRITNEIKWIFAEPSGWGPALEDKLIKLPERDWPWHQHSPFITSSGNLLFFNNNNYRARPFDKPQKDIESNSHVVEYKINEEKLTAEKVWSSEIPGETRIASVAMGSAAELPETGNILAGYGFIVSQMPGDTSQNYQPWTMVREYTHTQPPEILWELRLSSREKNPDVGWVIFSAHRVKFSNVKYLK